VKIWVKKQVKIWVGSEAELRVVNAFAVESGMNLLPENTPPSLALLRRMGHQIGDQLPQLFLSSGISRQRLRLKLGIEFIPDGIHFALEVASVGRDGDHRVFVRNHDA